MTMPRPWPAQRGVTLIELMVAMLLGLILTAGAIQVFISNRTTYGFNEGLARLQENGRFAIDMLNYRVRMAGYVGCLPGIRIDNNLTGSGDLGFDLEQGLIGFEAIGSAPVPASWSPALPAELVNDVNPGSDVLVIYNVNPNAYPLVSPFNSADQIFVDASVADFAVGEIAVVSDCQKASVFQITGTSASAGTGIAVAHASAGFTPGNALAAWDSGQEYGEGAEMLRAETWVYYVGARNGDGPPALFQRRLALSGTTVALAAQELVEGVDTMQILYGVDTDLDGSVDDYRAASTVTDWAEVVAVRIGLLLRSPEEYGTEVDTATYNVNGTLFDPVDDRRIRQLFTTTVALRNRLP